MKLFKKTLTIFFLLTTCCASISWAQAAQSFRRFNQFDVTCAEQEKRNNEFAYSGEPDGIFYCNSLTLDGMAFNYNGFSLESKGELKLIKGESKSYKTVEIPFYLHLRRNGITIPLSCGEGVIFSGAEVSAILQVAQDGDELIVEPANKEDWPAKRIIRIGAKC